MEVFEYTDSNHPHVVQVGTFESYQKTRSKVSIGDKIIVPNYKGGVRSAKTGILKLRTVKAFNSFHISTIEGGGLPSPCICWKLIE